MDRRGHMRGAHNFLDVGSESDSSQRETLGFMVWVSKWLLVLFTKTRGRREQGW